MRAGWTALLAAGLVVAGGAAAGGAPARPNILFLFTDDQRADAVGALGNPVVQTPHLDSLVRGGFAFRNAYCLGANMGAVCTPSRNMLLSGRTYFRWAGPLAPGDGDNLPNTLRAAGYETYHHGKRGNTALRIQGRFEHNRYLANDEAERRTGEPGREIADAAVAFLARRRRERPFAMYLAFGNPHDPRVAAQRYLDRYRRADIPLPRNYRPLHPFDNGELRVRDEQLAPWPRTESEIRRHLHEYYAVMTGLDEQIGRVLAELRRTGDSANTLVVFSSDHGLALGSHGLMGKQSVYEDSLKAPLVFSGPGIPRGRSSALAYLHDIYPTLCDLVGAPVPPGLDGRSLAPVLRGRRSGVRDSLFLAYRDVQRAIRDDRWKLIRYPRIQHTQLFDLRDDPHETRNLAETRGHEGQVRRLTGLLEEWQRELGDTAPLSVSPAAPKDWQP
jgi:arylsulfatase A-like enzyme